MQREPQRVRKRNKTDCWREDWGYNWWNDKDFQEDGKRRRSYTKRAGRRKRLMLENNEIKQEIKERFGRKKDGQMERKEKRRAATERREIWFLVVTVADPSLVLPSCNSGSSPPFLPSLSLWATVGCLYLVPITDCSALACCWDSRLCCLRPPWLPIYPSNTPIYNPTT